MLLALALALRLVIAFHHTLGEGAHIGTFAPCCCLLLCQCECALCPGPRGPFFLSSFFLSSTSLLTSGFPRRLASPCGRPKRNGEDGKQSTTLDLCSACVARCVGCSVLCARVVMVVVVVQSTCLAGTALCCIVWAPFHVPEWQGLVGL